MVEQIHITERIAALRKNASENFKIAPEECHIGHIVLQAMLDNPQMTHQIDGFTGDTETHISVANRSMRMASAMKNSGLKIGDHVVIMGNNSLDLCIPYFATHFNGYSMCAVDPIMTLADLKYLFKYITPKIVFCPKSKREDIKKALTVNCKEKAQVVVFDDPENNLETYVAKHKGTERIFVPAQFNQDKTICWLMLTSGTTGLPKVAIIPYSTLLNGLCSWWSQFTDKWHITMAMATIQWMSSLIFFISTPLMENVRLQSSVPITPQMLVGLINKYKPNVTAWTPYLLGQFLRAAGDFVDLSCFRYIAIGGSAIEKPLHDKFKEKCGAYLYLVYGMTELLVPVFDFNESTPFGSTGKPYDKFQYKLVSADGEVKEPNKHGELWIKGTEFFKGYLNNPEETDKLLTEDGWLMTGDIFYRNEENHYHFVERKRLLIKYTGFWISPLQLEEVIKKHPGVSEVCVVGIPDPETTETPVAVIARSKDSQVEAQEIFDLVGKEMPEIKQMHGGLFFVDALPETPSGKVHRAKVRDMALVHEKVYPVKQ